MLNNEGFFTLLQLHLVLFRYNQSIPGCIKGYGGFPSLKLELYPILNCPQKICTNRIVESQKICDHTAMVRIVLKPFLLKKFNVLIE